MIHFSRIGTKVAVTIALMQGLAFTLLTMGIDYSAREHLTREADQHARQLADTVWRTTRNAMLDGRHERIRRTIAFITHPGDIRRIQLLDHHGVVRYSSEPGDEGQRRQPTGPECGNCHGRTPRVTNSPPWSYREAHPGHASLGVVQPVYALPDCQRGGCHAPGPTTRVLGVLYVSVSLERHQASVARLRNRLFLFAGLLTALVTAVVLVLLNRMVSGPVRALVTGTRRLAAGDLDHRIAVRGYDEVGELGRAFNDTSEKLAWAQRQLVDAEKLVSVGRLAAGVAHEINNPLAGILTCAEGMRDEMDPGESQLRRDVDVIISETLRCRDIVRRLLDFARQRPTAKRPTSLNELVERVTHLLGRQASFAKVSISRQLDPALPALELDGNRIHQVLVNLLLNAAEAMPAGGVVTVETARSSDGTRALLRVSDTGGGIAPELRTRLFEPFFTTKAQGTGLGLAVAWGIVQQHQGKLSFTTEPGKGTTFIVELPLPTPPADAKKPGREPAAPT